MNELIYPLKGRPCFWKYNLYVIIMSMKKKKRLITKRPESFVVSFEKADVCISSIRSELLVNGYDLYVKNAEDQ